MRGRTFHFTHEKENEMLTQNGYNEIGNYAGTLVGTSKSAKYLFDNCTKTNTIVGADLIALRIISEEFSVGKCSNCERWISLCPACGECLRGCPGETEGEPEWCHIWGAAQRGYVAGDSNEGINGYAGHVGCNDHDQKLGAAIPFRSIARPDLILSTRPDRATLKRVYEEFTQSAARARRNAKRDALLG